MQDTIEIAVKDGYTYIKVNGVQIDRAYSVNRRDNGDIEIVIHKPRVVGESCQIER